MKILKTGVIITIFGTLLDLGWHAIHTPEEVFGAHGLELMNHLVITSGLALLVIGAVVVMVRHRADR